MKWKFWKSDEQPLTISEPVYTLKRELENTGNWTIGITKSCQLPFVDHKHKDITLYYFVDRVICEWMSEDEKNYISPFVIGCYNKVLLIEKETRDVKERQRIAKELGI